MGITVIKRVENHTDRPVRLRIFDSVWPAPADREVPARGAIAVDIRIPWAEHGHEFPGRHIRVLIGGVERYWIWQANHADGDFIRCVGDGQWRVCAPHVFGYARVALNVFEAIGGGLSGDAEKIGQLFLEERTLAVFESRVESMPLLATHPDQLPSLAALLAVAKERVPRARMVWSRRLDEPAVPSVPRRDASAFSIAARPSDALAAGTPGARFLYDDSGHRWDYRVDRETGAVTASRPDGPPIPIGDALSLTHSRLGTRLALPAVDLVAAGGGRVFAKVRGEDRFFFASMDETFVHARKGEPGREYRVPSTYFKLDPEFGRAEQVPAHLLASTDTMIGPDYQGHPAAERMPLFRQVLPAQLTDMMVASVEPRVWHELDFRPPQNVMGTVMRALKPMLAGAGVLGLLFGPQATAGALLLLLSNPAFYRYLQDAILAATNPELPALDIAPPLWIPTRDEATYERPDGARFHVRGIAYDKVLDIGVGHGHWHQQWEGTTGGEIQPVRTEADYATLYRFFNGPVHDGDGLIDGTANFYALVRHAASPGERPTYSLVYQDEQLYFSQRWRLAHPDDRKGLMFAAVADLFEEDGTPRARWQFDRSRFWCPFVARHVVERSRLAVAAQVVLVTGRDPSVAVPPGADPDVPGARIYSINWSWSSLDRSWRWRRLPEGAQVTYFPGDGADEATLDDQVPRVYPQSLRLRDDMTLHLRGSRAVAGSVVPGRWYQRYLPADNQPVPIAPLLPAHGMPEQGYTHPWKFVAERTFRRADRFSHLGVYDRVDGRTQYYELAVPPGAEAALAAADRPGGAAWVDEGKRLFVSQWKFRWDDTTQLGLSPMETPSLFNERTMLRITRRNGRWIAMHWDKRDDDLRPFDGLPAEVTLTREGVAVTVTLVAHRKVTQPPAVRTAYAWTEPGGWVGIAFEVSAPASDLRRENVARVRLAAFAPVPGDATRLGDVVELADLPRERFVELTPTLFTYRWQPAPDVFARIAPHLSADAAALLGTSLWFENVTGQVATPERILWQRSAELRVTVSPALIALGVPTAVVVRAEDLRTQAPCTGQVLVTGGTAARTAPLGQAFTHTFTNRVVQPPPRDPDDKLGGGGTIPEEPTVYPPVLTAFVTDSAPTEATGVEFYQGALAASATPASVPLGIPVTLTVAARDSRTQAPVAATVRVDGTPVGTAGTPFTHTFAAATARVTVAATGYTGATVALAFYAPTLRVTVDQPSFAAGVAQPVTVRAVDAGTGVAVAGTVLVNGAVAGSTGTPFTQLFGNTAPAGLVRAPGYPDAAIAWPPVVVRTLYATYAPRPLKFGRPTPRINSVTVTARDAASGQLVTGTVRHAGKDIGVTGVAFSFGATYRIGPDGEILYPSLIVRAPGYHDFELSLDPLEGAGIVPDAGSTGLPVA